MNSFFIGFFYSLKASLKTGLLFANLKNFWKEFARKLFAFFKIFKKYSLFIIQYEEFGAVNLASSQMEVRLWEVRLGLSMNGMYEHKNSQLTRLTLKRNFSMKLRIRNHILVLPRWFWKLLDDIPIRPFLGTFDIKNYSLSPPSRFLVQKTVQGAV